MNKEERKAAKAHRGPTCHQLNRKPSTQINSNKEAKSTQRKPYQLKGNNQLKRKPSQLIGSHSNSKGTKVNSNKEAKATQKEAISTQEEAISTQRMLFPLRQSFYFARCFCSFLFIVLEARRAAVYLVWHAGNAVCFCTLEVQHLCSLFVCFGTLEVLFCVNTLEVFLFCFVHESATLFVFVRWKCSTLIIIL